MEFSTSTSAPDARQKKKKLMIFIKTSRDSGKQFLQPSRSCAILLAFIQNQVEI
jgi:hypothetical protein